jgi:hypothetical protein
MAYARPRQERYIKTAKGKAAINRSRTKEQKKLRSTLEGRITLRYRKIKCEWGKYVADWWLKQKPICFMCGPEVIYEKAPSRKNGRQNKNELAIDHDHKYSKKDYRKNPNLEPRGLLCQRHNMAFGQFGENIDEFKRAIKYKRKYG